MPPAWGKPTCKQWWEDGAIGLRQKLIDQADATASGLSGLVVAVAPALAGEQQKDAVARTVLANSPPVWSSNDLVANNTGSTGLVGTAENLFKGGLAAGGVVTASALFSVTVTAVLQALPLLWSGMMAWAGVRVGRSIDAMAAPLQAPAQDAGRQGGGIGKTVVSKAGQSKRSK